MQIDRHDYLDGPSLLSVTMEAHGADEGHAMFFGADDAMATLRQLVDLAAAATAAAEQLHTLIHGAGTS